MKPIRIDDSDGLRALRFAGDGDAMQSLIDPDQPQRLVMENLQYLMSILLFIPEPERILLLGIGGGALVHFLRHHYPRARITGVERDPRMLEIASNELALPKPGERLDYIIADGAGFIGQDTGAYDLIVTDIFTGPQSPAWVTETPFLRAVADRLSDRGGAAWNLLIGSERDFLRFYQSLRRVFDGRTLCLEHDDHENLLAMGFNARPKPMAMAERLEQARDLGERLELPLPQALARLHEINPAGEVL